jgi:RNA polymerase-binding transcription factor DksA
MDFGMRYFTLEQRDALREWLENRASVLRAELNADLKEDLGAEPELAATQRDADELRDVAAALARLDEPNFGRCTGCGEDIPYVRLKANPAARLCMTCQERGEQRRRVMGG